MYVQKQSIYVYLCLGTEELIWLYLWGNLSYEKSIYTFEGLLIKAS